MTWAWTSPTKIAARVAVVLGADAVERLDPDGAAESLGSTHARLFICVGACLPTIVAAWVKAGFDAALPSTIDAELDRLPRRVRLGPKRWLGRDAPPRGSRAWRMAAAVDDLEHLSVEALAASLGCSESTVGRLCGSALDCKPKELLYRYVVVAAEDLRSRHVSRGVASAELGYADSVSLDHALQRAHRRGLGPK
jgi:AraC-like DNA-binding protein